MKKLIEKIRKFLGIKTKEEKEREKRRAELEVEFQKKLEELRKRDPFIYHNR
jgi:hypothetical protein